MFYSTPESSAGKIMFPTGTKFTGIWRQIYGDYFWSWFPSCVSRAQDSPVQRDEEMLQDKWSSERVGKKVRNCSARDAGAKPTMPGGTFVSFKLQAL